ncbi:hypothetical protein D3C87_2041790 [compost metagenome]
MGSPVGDNDIIGMIIVYNLGKVSGKSVHGAFKSSPIEYAKGSLCNEGVLSSITQHISTAEHDITG